MQMTSVLISINGSILLRLTLLTLTQKDILSLNISTNLVNKSKEELPQWNLRQFKLVMYTSSNQELLTLELSIMNSKDKDMELLSTKSMNSKENLWMTYQMAQEKKQERKLFMKVALKTVFMMAKEPWPSPTADHIQDLLPNINSTGKENLLEMME